MPFTFIHSVKIGTGQPIVLLHAFPLSHLVWKDIEPPPGYRFVLPDFPGFGLSPVAPEGFTLQEASMGLQNHLEKSGIKEPFLLGGISMGGYWAMEFARQFPQRIRGLILISTKPGLDLPENRQKRLKIASRVEKEGTSFLVNAMLPGLLGKTTRETNPSLVETISQWIIGTQPKAVALAQRAMADRRDQTDLLAQIKARTLVLAGVEDGLIPASEANAMSKVLPSAQLKLFQAVGHLIPLESPQEFQKSLNEFFLRGFDKPAFDKRL